MKERTIDLCEMQIVLPLDHTEVENSAAQELWEYLMKMCGVNIPVVKEDCISAEKKAIYIGDTAYASACQADFPNNCFDEGWAIQAINGDLVLRGGRQRGVLYAVYHLLEDVFGVHWWTIWDETVPQIVSARMPADYTASGVPAMAYRDVFAWPIETDSRFAVRNRLNGWATPITEAFGGMETFGEPAHVHTFDRYFPEYGYDQGNVKGKWADLMNPERESYYLTHPEWYGISPRGKRIPKVLCMSNESVQQALLEKLKKSIAFSYAEADAAGKSRPRYFDLSPADMRGECCCPRCAESIRKHGSSGHQLRFINKIAKEVKKDYPEVVIETIIYWQYLIPPKDDTRPAEDVLVRYCNNKMDILHSILHPNNRQYLEGLTTWSKLCGPGNLYLWDYGVHYNPNGIVPSMYKLADNFQMFRKLGVNGYFLEMEHCITTDMWDIKVWMASKLMENPDLDQDELMDTFLKGYYGDAAEAIRRYLDAAHIRTEEYGACYDYCAASLIHADGFTVKDILYYDRCFTDALKAVEGDCVLCKRVNHARLGLDRVIVENFCKWSSQAEELGISLPFSEKAVGARIYKTLSEQIAYRGQWDPKGAETLKLYEKYLPDTAVEEVSSARSREAYLVRLHGCKDAWRGVSPTIVSPAELEAIPRNCIYEFTAQNDFSEWLEYDEDSILGAAACFDVAYMRKAHIISQELLDFKWAVMDNVDEKCIPLAVYSGENDESGWPISAVWGTIRASDIVADGKYHIYKFSDVVAVARENGGVFHMFRDWAMSIHSFSLEMGHLVGKKVDCYLSMKVNGDVTCQDMENLPAYWVDRIIVADLGCEN